MLSLCRTAGHLSKIVPTSKLIQWSGPEQNWKIYEIKSENLVNLPKIVNFEKLSQWNKTVNFLFANVVTESKYYSSNISFLKQ